MGEQSVILGMADSNRIVRTRGKRDIPPETIRSMQRQILVRVVSGMTYEYRRTTVHRRVSN